MKLPQLPVLFQESAIMYMLLTSLVTHSQSKERDASSYAKELTPDEKSLHKVTRSTLPFRASPTSTVRPWPSHNFFKTVLNKSNQTHANSKDVNNLSRSKNHKHQRAEPEPLQVLPHKRGFLYKIENKVYKRRLNETTRLRKSDFFTRNANERSKNDTEVPTKNDSAVIQSDSHDNFNGMPPFTKVNKESQIRIPQLDNEQAGSQTHNPRPTKIGFLGPHLSKKVKEKSLPLSNISTKNQSRIRTSKISTPIMETTLISFAKTMPTLSKTLDKPPFSFSSRAELPFSVISSKIRTSPKKETYKIVSPSSTTKGKIPANKSVKRNRNKLDDEEWVDKLHQWIEKDNEISVLPPSVLPNFTSLKWPYTTKKQPNQLSENTTTAKPVTRYETLKGTKKGNKNKLKASALRYPTTNVPATSKQIENRASTWKRVPTMSVDWETTTPLRSTPMTPLYWDTMTSDAEDNELQSDGPSSKPEFNQQYNEVDFVSRPTDKVSSSIQSSDPSSSKPSTNIWYKPVINHFSSSSQSSNSKLDIADFPIVFKIWTYKDGTLTLENEKEIPKWALQGYALKDGFILNKEQIPKALLPRISSAIKKYEDKQKDNKFKTAQGYLPTEVHFSRTEQPPMHEMDFNVLGFPNNLNDHAPLNINYVIFDTKLPTRLPINLNHQYDEYLLSKFPKTQSPTRVAPTVSTTMDYLDEYLQLLRTPQRPTVSDNRITEKDLWNKLHNMISNVASTPVDEPSTTALPIDSLPLDETESQKLLANLAAVAILISYMKTHNSSLLQINAPKTTTTVKPKPNPTQTSKSPIDFDKAMFQLFQQLLSRNHIPFDKLKQSTNEDEIQSNKFKSDFSSQYEPNGLPTPSAKLEKTLLLQGFVKKGKKNKKAKKKKKLHKKGKKGKKFLLKKKAVAVLHKILKKPKKYWFDLSFDVDIHSIMKKKFLYILAFKYAPAFFVIVLALVPIGLILIPILYKIYWIKKKPRYIRVPIPVPVPKPYPVYPKHGWDQGPHPVLYSPYNDDFDHPMHSNKMDFSDHRNGEEFDDDLNRQDMQIKDISPDQSPIQSSGSGKTFPLSHPPLSSLKPHAVGKAYDLGFDLGSKLSSLTNVHDKNVMQILLENKKDKIHELLEKWKLLHKGNSYQVPPALSLEILQHPHKSSRRRKRGTRKKRK